MRSLGLVALVVLLALGRPALADRSGARRSEKDRMEANVRHLEGGEGYKLRLSAALWLARTSAPRAIEAMIRAVQVEPVRSVRRVAALSLGKMVDRSTSADLRERARKALRIAAERDRDDKVRRNARRSLARIEKLPPPSSKRRSKEPRVFVHVGKAKDLTRTGPRVLPRYLRETVARSLGEHAPAYRLRWPTGGVPTQADLQKYEAQGYFVGASVVKFRVQRRGKGAEVKCSISMHVSVWQGSDVQEKWSEQEAASATGSGTVMSAYTQKGIARAKCDCALAVAAKMTEREVVPFLKKMVATH